MTRLGFLDRAKEAFYGLLIVGLLAAAWLGAFWLIVEVMLR